MGSGGGEARQVRAFSSSQNVSASRSGRVRRDSTTTLRLRDGAERMRAPGNFNGSASRSLQNIIDPARPARPGAKARLGGAEGALK